MSQLYGPPRPVTGIALHFSLLFRPSCVQILSYSCLAYSKIIDERGGGKDFEGRVIG
jgi:hypothetical protein